MDTSSLKKYATKARREFIEAVTLRANKIGVFEDRVEDYREEGDLLILGAETFPKEMKKPFEELRTSVQRDGFEQTIDTMAYTWFNRFMALRYMEVHGYLDFRVLSSSSSHPHPDILQQAHLVNFGGAFKKDHVDKLLNEATKDEELYRYLLVAQCNELHKAMPFLFERVSDLSELLLPDSLLATDSLVRSLVTDIEESVWQEGVEIIGWLYQFYIAEKKDEVIGKVVKSEDIPAATQLFTTDWIVKYLVQNSVGAYWLRSNPNSSLRYKMEYFVEPAEQTAEVDAQLKESTPHEINPETITLLDPACGSGHILVEAYDLIKEIYLECGYRPREIPSLILSKNLFGLDIDRRAAQMAGFAVLMKARADDRDIFSRDIQIDICEVQSSNEISFKQCAETLFHKKESIVPSDDLFPEELSQLALQTEVKDAALVTHFTEFLGLFEDAKTLGSLIQIPKKQQRLLPLYSKVIKECFASGDIYQYAYANKLIPIDRQARILSAKYNCVVTNPPYMGSKYFPSRLKGFVKNHYPKASRDLFAAFIERCFNLCESSGYFSAITMESWMFLSSYADLRQELFNHSTLDSLVHMPYDGRGRTSLGINFGTTAFVFQRHVIPSFKTSFSCLRYFEIDELGVPFEFPTVNERASELSIQELKSIPGSPLAYWASQPIINLFVNHPLLGEVAEVRQGLATADDNQFLRRWFEVPYGTIEFNVQSAQESDDADGRWYPFTKGGDYRRWYGNNEFVVNWQQNGKRLRAFERAVIRNPDFYFRQGITYTTVSSARTSFRLLDPGYVLGHRGSGIFCDPSQINSLLAFLNSKVALSFLSFLCPTVAFEIGQMKLLPIVPITNKIDSLVEQAIEISRADWNSREISWNFETSPLLNLKERGKSIKAACTNYSLMRNETIDKMLSIELAIEKEIIGNYKMESEVEATFERSEITLQQPNDKQLVTEWISFAVGCMMGRYSLLEKGVVFAESANENLSLSRYSTDFLPDDDGVIPVLTHEWFEDDAATRFRRLIETIWGKSSIDESLEFIGSTLNPRKGEKPSATLRRYFADSFFNDHLKLYRKRPIYWLLSSGKEKAFQALVYLHRYNENTLSQMRTEYVLPLQSKFSSEVDKIIQDIESASSPSEKSKYEKKLKAIRKKQAELITFDEELQHYANQRIKLDLDDGVKVNYGKFGNLLAEVKSVTGKKPQK